MLRILLPLIFHARLIGILLVWLAPVHALSQLTPEILIQDGHSSDVSAVAYSPDGTTLASGSWDNTVKLWEVASGKLLRTLAGHTSAVNAVGYSPDGSTLASGSWDDTVKLWEVASGKLLRTLMGHTSPVLAVAYSPNGTNLTSSSKGKTVKLWETASGKLLRTLEGHTSSVLAVAYSPDGTTLASGSSDQTVKLWEVASGKLLRTLEGHTSSVQSVAYSPDGTLASGSRDETVKLWETTSGKLLRTLAGHTSYVSAVAYSPDGSTLASGSWDHTVKLWEAASGKLLRTLAGHTSFVYAVAYSPDGTTLASGSRDQTAKLWEAASEKLLRTLEGHSSVVYAMAYSPDGTTLASGSSDKTVKLWAAASGKLLRTLEGHTSYVSTVAYSPDGTTLASGSWDHTVKLWEAASGKLLRTLVGHSSDVSAVAYSPDGGTLASGSRDHTVMLWEATSGKLLRHLVGHDSYVHAVAYSPDGTTLASGSRDHTMKLWEAGSGKLLQTLEGDSFQGHHSPYVSVAYSPDGNTLASGSRDHTVKLWEAASGKLLRLLVGHASTAYAVAYSPDGTTLASGHNDKTVKLWEAASGKLLQTLVGHASVVYAVAYSPDGTTLASGSRDSTIRFWNLEKGTQIATILTLDQSNWVAWTPEGYYDASPNAAELVNWAGGDHISSFDQYEEVFHKPEMIRRALRGGTLLLPEIRIGETPVLSLLNPTSYTDKSVIDLSLGYRGNNEFGTLIFLLNGVPLEEWAPPKDGVLLIPLSLKQYKNHFRAQVIDKELRHSAWLEGEILFTKALNTWELELDKSVPEQVFQESKVILNGIEHAIHHGDSKTRTLSFLGGQDLLRAGLNYLKAAKQTMVLWNEQNKLTTYEVPYAEHKSYAIIAAIDDYRREKAKGLEPTGYENLNGMLTRAEQLSVSLEDLGFPRKNIFRFYDQKATRTNLSNLLKEFWEGGSYADADRLFFYFGGHGDAANENGYLITYDFDPKQPTRTGLLMKDLTGRHFQNAKVHHFLVALDSCSAGLALPKTSGSPIKKGLKTLAQIRADTEKQARDILVAGTGDQRALVRTGGVFTTALIAAFQGGADENRDGVMQFYELAGYVRNQVVGVAGPLGVNQKPDKFEYKEGRNLFLIQR